MTRPSIWTVVRTASRVGGEVMITFGLIVLLFAAYEIWGVGAKVNAHQAELAEQLAQEWGSASLPAASAEASADPSATATTDPMPGSALARLYIPRMRSEPWVVVEGVTAEDIRYAPGHYPETAMPGEVGNFSVAGHRTPAIFWDLDQVVPGDLIVVETQEAWYTYTVTRQHIVSPTAVEVVAAVPNQPGETATAAMLTVTTCNPKGNNYERLVIHAELTDQQSRDAGQPAALTG